MHLAMTLEVMPLQGTSTSLKGLDTTISTSSKSTPASGATDNSLQFATVIKPMVVAETVDPETRHKDSGAMSNVDKDIAKLVSEITQDQEPVKIDSRDIDAIMDQYIVAYRKGDRQQMLSLFADDSKLQRPLTLKTIQAQYNDLFSRTDERGLEFSGLTWEQHESEARGEGQLRTSFRVLPGGEMKTVMTKVMLAMRKIDNVTRITDFQLNDNSMFALPPRTSNHKAADLTGNNKSEQNLNPSSNSNLEYPTDAELHNLVSQYMESYQAGDIDRLMQLFASSNWTKAPEGLIELRQDYTELFHSTLKRQIAITNMDWSYKGNKALGTGDLAINLQSNGSQKITKNTGKVRLIVEKKGTALFSHMFQIVN